MPEVNKEKFLSPIGITCFINGPAGSGKTRLGMGFPNVMAATFDPTGLDVLKEPENVKLLDNLRWHVPLNGLELRKLFQYTEEPSEDSLYGAIALAKKLGPRGEKKISTFFLDGFTYLTQLKWTAICEAKGIDPSAKEQTDKRDADQRAMYDALGSYLDHLMLQNVFPLATQHDLNVVVSCHVQRESENTVKGIQIARTQTALEQQAQSKRQVNLESDLSPQVLGSFRQRIDGLPSATIYLEHRLTEKDGKESLQYIAYCKLARSTSLDTVIRGKNRFGLGTLDLTNGSFYNTLLRKINQSREAVATTK